jgi:hypothetical protein
MDHRYTLNKFASPNPDAIDRVFSEVLKVSAGRARNLGGVPTKAVMSPVGARNCVNELGVDGT